MWPLILPSLQYIHGSLRLQKTARKLVQAKQEGCQIPYPQPQEHLFNSWSAIIRTPQKRYFCGVI